MKALVEYNHLESIVALHQAVTEPGHVSATIEDSSNYLANRLGSLVGIAVPAATLDTIYRELALPRINFLKMNIEGAERPAIRGMAETLRQTEVVCISCHDFLADRTGDESYRTCAVVREFLQENGFKTVERTDPSLPAYVRCQLWGYNKTCALALPA